MLLPEDQRGWEGEHKMGTIPTYDTGRLRRHLLSIRGCFASSPDTSQPHGPCPTPPPSCCPRSPEHGCRGRGLPGSTTSGKQQPLAGCKLSGAPGGHLLGARSKARRRPCNSMVHLGELEHCLFVYFMMHFGLSQLRCYPTPVRSPFSGLITGSTLCGAGAWPGSCCSLRGTCAWLPTIRAQGQGRGRKFPSVGTAGSAPWGARCPRGSEREASPCWSTLPRAIPAPSISLPTAPGPALVQGAGSLPRSFSAALASFNSSGIISWQTP